MARLIETQEQGRFTAKIFLYPSWDEYQVKFYNEDKLIPEATRHLTYGNPSYRVGYLIEAQEVARSTLEKMVISSKA